jgi:hypothetical protein
MAAPQRVVIACGRFTFTFFKDRFSTATTIHPHSTTTNNGEGFSLKHSSFLSSSNRTTV